MLFSGFALAFGGGIGVASNHILPLLRFRRGSR